MKSYILREGAIRELNALALGGVVDITSEAVRNSAFYEAVQTKGGLCCSGSIMKGLPPATLLLIAKIAATSPTIHTVCISINYLGAHGPATATALAKSPVIHTVDMSCNALDKHGPDTAAALAKSDTIHTVLTVKH